MLDSARPDQPTLERERHRSHGTPVWHRKLWRMIALTDAAVITLTLVLVELFRGGPDEADFLALRHIDPSYVLLGGAQVPFPAVMVIIGAVWFTSLEVFRARQPRTVGASVAEFRGVIEGTVYGFGAIAVAAYLARASLSRSYFLLSLGLGLVLLLVARILWRPALRRLREGGRYRDRTVAVGRRADIDHVISELKYLRTPSLEVVAACELAGTADERADFGPHLDHLRITELTAYAGRDDVDCVLLAGPIEGGRTAVRQLTWELENTDVDLVLFSRLTDVAGPRIHYQALEGIPLLYLSLPRFSGPAYAAKRVMDVLISGTALLVLSPLMLIIAALIRLDDGGPVFFRQERAGQGGAPFTMLKFRSMSVDAHERRSELVNEGAGPLFKVRNDPRVTRIGRHLRRASLDELPQLINIFRGDMSLVGPRPPLLNEVAAYDAVALRRLLIRPGLTGLWQVSGRSNLSWQDSIRLDLRYVENWSVTGDIAILARTVAAVLKRDGAF